MRTTEAIKMAARRVLTRAVRDGALVRPRTCTKCGSGKGTIHGHHPDYNKPLGVEWLCASCHSKEHRDLRVSGSPAVLKAAETRRKNKIWINRSLRRISETENKVLSIAEVSENVTLSEAQISKRERLGCFPERCSVGEDRVAWLESEIDAWIEALPTKVNVGSAD